MAAKVTVILDPAGIQAAFRTVAMVQAMEQVAEQIRDAVPAALAETEPHPYSVGRYVDGLEVAAGIEDGVATGAVNAHARHSGFLEFGTVDTPVMSPLRRAAERWGPLQDKR